MTALRTVPGPDVVDWPDEIALGWCELGHAGEAAFLWFDKVTPKSNDELLRTLVRPQGFRKRFGVARQWDPKAKMKMDRGDGGWPDVAAYDRRTPVVTPRVKQIFEAIQPDGLEFLPVRATALGQVGDVFLVNVTTSIACLDIDASSLPMPPAAPPFRQEGPHALVMIADRMPRQPCFFRVAEYPEAILASRAMVDRLRTERLSGLSFVGLADYAVP